MSSTKDDRNKSKSATQELVIRPAGCQALIGSRAICDYLGVSRTVLRDLIAAGLPVRPVGARSKRLCSHTSDIDDFFRK